MSKGTNIDHCVPLAQMGALLTELVHIEPGEQPDIPEDIIIEAKIAKRIVSDLPSVEKLGHQVPFNCPDCGGVLWQIEGVESLRYRCHTGHAFTAGVLLGVQTAAIEETLWIALRMFEERKSLMVKMSKTASATPSMGLNERAEESTVHIQRIREMLRASHEANSAKAL